MSKYMVCHVPDSQFRYVPNFCKLELRAFFHKHKADYKLVAMVDTDNLDEAYALTNSIGDGWWNNEKVESDYTDEAGKRSTSVGDLIITDKNEFHVVGAFGFINVSGG